TPGHPRQVHESDCSPLGRSPDSPTPKSTASSPPSKCVAATVSENVALAVASSPAGRVCARWIVCSDTSMQVSAQQTGRHDTRGPLRWRVADFLPCHKVVTLAVALRLWRVRAPSPRVQKERIAPLGP